MEIRQQHQASYAPRPRSYAALMEMYETNYMRIRLLCGDVRVLEGTLYSHVSNGLSISLKIVDKARYTTTILLSYQFSDNNKHHHNRPDLRIRIYHDSRQAEVLSRQCHFTQKNIKVWEAGIDNALLCRWRLNRFLFKWIAYLRRQGHQFN
jgi:uncharacterized protein YqiB (DUF1249 family)